MSNFNALNPIRKAEIIQRRLFGKIKDYLARNDDDKDKTITELTTDVDSSFNKILTRCKYSPLDFNGATKLSDLAENRVNIPTLTEMGGILTVKQTIHQNSSELFKIETHTGGHVIISSDSIPNTGGTASIITTTEMPLNFTTLTDVSNSKLKDVYAFSSQVGNHLGKFTTYTALRDISNGTICMTELSNNKVYAVMTDPSRNSLSGNAVKYLLGVALEGATAQNPVKILSNGYCTIRGDFSKQVPEDPTGVTQGVVNLDDITNGNIYVTDVSGIIFTDSGGSLQNYNSNQNYQVTFDAGLDKKIELTINELFTEHGFSSLYDRLGFQVSEDGKEWENADISGLIQTDPSRPEQLLPPWPEGGTGTAKNNSLVLSNIDTGWIFPERHEEGEPNSLFATRMDNSGNPTGTNTSYAKEINAAVHLDKMKRYIRFYFRSDGSGDYSGWNILVKSSSTDVFDSVTRNSILYLSQSEEGKATTFTGSGIRVGYSVIDSSRNEPGKDFTYARIQDINN